MFMSSEHSISSSPYKQIKSSRRRSHTTRSFVYRRTENLTPIIDYRSFYGSRLCLPPVPNYSSYSVQSLPPLLPLTITTHPSRLSSSWSQSFNSCAPPPPPNRKNSRARDQSLTPKKSKKPTKPKQESGTDHNIVLQKDIVRFLESSSIVAGDVERFSGSVFAISPPPSSLPLPKFSVMRPKMSCNVEAATGIDAGATDNLRRLLRI